MWFLLPTVLMSVAVSGDIDGCWNQIPLSAITSVAGSTGYSVSCSAAATAATPSTNSTTLLSKAETVERSPSGSHKAVFKKPYRRPLIALLETDRESSASMTFGRLQKDDGSYKVCFSLASSSSSVDSSVYAQFTLASTYVLRGVQFSDAPYGLATPSSYTLNMQPAVDAATASSWYVSQSDGDNGIPWTSIKSGSGAPNRFDNDFAGQVLKVVPKPLTATMNSNGFGATFFGCPVESTALVSFKFKSTTSAVIARFGSVSSFASHLSEYVCSITNLSPSGPSPCNRILFADVSSSTSVVAANATDPYQPSQLPTLEVFYRVLPADSSSCTDCRTAAEIQAELASTLSDPTSVGSAIMRAIDTWIEDSDPYTCYTKQCSPGTLCVNGVCVSPADLAAQEAVQIALQSNISFVDASSFDQILKLSPLDVISGVDQTAGLIAFANTPAPAGGIPPVVGGAQSGPTTTPTPSSSDESPVQRFFIPIVVVGAVTAFILILIAWRMYKRSYMTERQRLIAP